MQTDDIGIDVSSALDSISQDIFGGREELEQEVEAVETQETEAPASVETQTEAQPEPIAPPSSWSKDKHEYWGKMPREAQEYYNVREKQMLDGLEQYKGGCGFWQTAKRCFYPVQGISERSGHR